MIYIDSIRGVFIQHVNKEYESIAKNELQTTTWKK